MGRILTAIASSTAALVMAACSSPPAAPPQTVTVTTSVAPPSATAGPAPVPALPAPITTSVAVSETWTMPNLIGRNLQAAQDTIQSVTGNPMFYSTSTDLTGKGRAQIMDRNWLVCSSTPPPGATFGSGTSVDFGVVRIDVETCP